MKWYEVDWTCVVHAAVALFVSLSWYAVLAFLFPSLHEVWKIVICMIVSLFTYNLLRFFMGSYDDNRD